MSDHYEILGVARDADFDAVKQAYRSKAMAAHPDRNGGSDEKMHEVQQAYECLSDPLKRAMYDVGDTHSETKAEIEAAGLLRVFMDEAIDDGAMHLPTAIAIRIERGLQSIKQKIRTSGLKRKRLLKWRGRVTRIDDGENAVEAIVDEKLLAVEKELIDLNYSADLNQRARALLAVYGDNGEPLDDVEAGRVQQLIGGPT